MNIQKALRPTSRDAIVDAAIETLARNPGASLSEIALRAGVGRATLHRHFATRSDLIRTLIEQSMDETEAAANAPGLSNASANETFIGMLEAVIPLGDRYHFLFNESATNEVLQARYEGELKWVEELVDGLKRECIIDRQVPTRWVVANIDMQIWLAWCEVAAGNLAPTEASGVVYRTLVHGLASGNE